MANMVWQDWPTKSSTKDYNFIPQMHSKFEIPHMPSKFVEKAFLVGGFVGSKSQAGSSPYRAQISLNDVILEQLVQLGLNLYTDIIARTNCDSHKTMSQKVPVTNFNWRTHSMSNCKSMDSSTSDYFKHCPGSKDCDNVNNKTNEQQLLPITTRHSQEEIVYEDKDEGGNSIYVYQEVQKSTCEVTKTSMFHIRSRTISNCSIESDDSFIIFESNEDDSLEDDDVIGNECDNEEEEEDQDDSDDDEEDDEEEEIELDVSVRNFGLDHNEIESSTGVSFKRIEFDDNSDDELNECEEVDNLDQLDCHSQADSPRIIEANKKWNFHYELENTSSKPQKKKVSFASGNQLVQIRKMITWDYALRAARKGPWEMLALDRNRFKSKVQQLSNIICPILEHGHRKKIFQQRFVESSLSST